MFFDKPALPKSIAHWFADPILVTRLREIISDPVFQTACATLTEQAQPTFSNVVNSSNNNELRCWLAGYTDFVRDLTKLTKVPVDKREQANEWAHIS